MTQIAFLLYPDMTALDAVGPCDMLAGRRATEIMVPGAEEAQATA